MNELELKQFKDQVRVYRKTHDTRQKCLRSLRDSDIVDSRGKLTAPYRPLAKRSKSK